MSSSPFGWTKAVARNFDSRLNALASVPIAQPHEAPNSWLMRAAAMQGCSPSEFAAYLGFTFRADFDFQYYFVFRKTPPETPQVQPLEHGRIFTSSRSRAIGLWRRAPYGHRGRYGYCPMCLKGDRVPCIHLYARIEELVFCPWHRCLLEHQCPNCNGYVDLMQDMATAGPQRRGIEDLSLCMACGDPLYSMDSLAMDAQFVSRLPYWLRHWGKNGPEPIRGTGMTRGDYMTEHRRLSNPPPSMDSLRTAQRRARAALRDDFAAATVRAAEPTPEVQHSTSRSRP